MKHIVYVILAGLLIACAASSAPAVSPGEDVLPSVERIVEDYPHWMRLTAEPRNVSFALMALCRLPTEDESAFLDSVHGDHFLNVYVNEAGVEAMTLQGEPIFPVGSVIVKEKLAALDDASPAALGMMIKREPGFNPAGGDWEYVYWKRSGEVARGPEQLANCQACHVAQSQTDSVFRPYVSIAP